MKKLLALLTVAVFLVAGCITNSDDKKVDLDNNNNNNGTGGTYNISGTVKTDSATGTGVSGVIVTLTGSNSVKLTATTASDGTYSFTNITAGDYTVAVTKNGYAFAGGSCAVNVNDKSVAVAPIVGTQTNTSGTGGANTYLSYKAGATWSYNDHSAYGTSSYDETYTETVTGTRMAGGKTYWVLVTAYSDYADTSFVRIENNTAYMYFDNFDMVAKTAKPAGVRKALRMSSSMEVPFFKFSNSQGTIYDIYNYALGGVSVKLTGKYIGAENVSVPAGSFQNCAKFEITIFYQEVVNNVTSSDTTIETMWFAPNVGLAKESYTSSSSGGSSSSQNSYVETMTLTSYKIPN